MAAQEQRPELWNLFNTRIKPGEHFRAFPISTGLSWTCGSTSPAKASPCPHLFQASAQGDASQEPAGAADRRDTPALEGETIETVDVRFRTVGDMTCTCPLRQKPAHRHRC